MIFSPFTLAFHNSVWQVRRGLEPLAAFTYEWEALADAEWRERNAALAQKREPLRINHKVIGAPLSWASAG